MRAYELHCHAKQVGRSSGRSSVAAAAYRAGIELVDERTGLVHDYTKKQGIEHTQIYTPDTAPDWARDRGQLWNAAEAKENRKNSTTAHELEVAFPAEFNAMQRREAGDRLARELVERYNVAVDIAYHAPSKNGDQRNYHAHILFTTRGFDDSAVDGWSKNKFRDLAPDTKDENKDFYRDNEGNKTTRGKLEILDLRAFTADTMNHIAERDNLPVKTEHLSFQARGIDREPTQKMGAVATGIERIEGVSIRGDINREIQAANDNRATLYDHKNVIELELKRLERGLPPAQFSPFPDTIDPLEQTPLHERETGVIADEYIELARNPLSDLQCWNDAVFHRGRPDAAHDRVLLHQPQGRTAEHNGMQPLPEHDSGAGEQGDAGRTTGRESRPRETEGDIDRQSIEPVRGRLTADHYDSEQARIKADNALLAAADAHAQTQPIEFLKSGATVKRNDEYGRVLKTHNDGTYAVSFVDKDKPKNEDGFHPYRKEILERHHFELVRDLDFKEEKKYQAEQKRNYEERQAAWKDKAERIGQYSAAKERTIDAKIKDSDELRQRDEARENLAQAQVAFDEQNTFWRRLFQYRDYWEAKDTLDNRRRQLADAEERAQQFLDYMNSQRPSEKARQREESRAADTARQEEAEQERQTMEAAADKHQRDNAIVKEAQTSPEAAKRLQHALQGETIQEKTDITTAQGLAKDYEAKEAEQEKRERKRKAEKEQRGFDGEAFEDKSGHHRQEKEQQNADILKQQQLEKDRQAEREAQEDEQAHTTASEALEQRKQAMQEALNTRMDKADIRADNSFDDWHGKDRANDNNQITSDFDHASFDPSSMSLSDKMQAEAAARRGDYGDDMKMSLSNDDVSIEARQQAWQQWQNDHHNSQELDNNLSNDDPERERGL